MEIPNLGVLLPSFIFTRNVRNVNGPQKYYGIYSKIIITIRNITEYFYIDNKYHFYFQGAVLTKMLA